MRSASPSPFGTSPRVNPLSELSELSELDNPSPRCHWLPAAAPSSRALALFGGGAGLQLRPCRPPRTYRPRPCFVFEWLHSHRILPSTATALSIVVQCFTALAPSRSSALLLDTSDNSLHCLSTPPRRERLSLGGCVSAAPPPGLRASLRPSMCPLPSPSPNTASSFSALLGALAQPPVVLDFSDSSDNTHLPAPFYSAVAQSLTPPFGTSPRVTPLSELSELSELDNPSHPRSWLPAAASSSRALALFGGGARLQPRPHQASPAPVARIPALSSGGCIVATSAPTPRQHFLPLRGASPSPSPRRPRYL